MRLDGQRTSSNVEDRRGMSPMMKGGGLGCGGLIIVLVLSYLTGIDPRQLLQTADQVVPQQQSAPQGEVGAPSDSLGQFASTVLGSTEDVWGSIFSQRGRSYAAPTLVLFSGGVQSACGMASSASGPFYCPLDGKLYLDGSFFAEMSQRFGAPGDFAQAYVIAHEVGHHVQNLLGIADQVQSAQERAASQEEANRYSVAMELQADCLAGVWGHHAQSAGIIEPGDFEEGLSAASAIGDDRMQKMSRGHVAPESFTHGSSAQRVEWLHKGLQSGNPDACEM
jgi:predicted metalloprotease